MLNNQLAFTSILDYSTTELEDAKSLRAKVNDKFNKLAEIVGNKEEPIQIISFYDPNDVFGFPIPSGGKLDKRIRLINVPISHSTQWTIDGQKLKQYYLYQLPLGKLKDQIAFEIGDQRNFNILTDLEEPSEAAKNNRDVFRLIRQGHEQDRSVGSANRELLENVSQAPQNGNPSKEEKEGVGEDSATEDFSPFSYKFRDKIYWKTDNRARKLKNIFKIRSLILLRKIAGMYRSVELPHTRPPAISIPGIEKVSNRTKKPMY